MGHLRFLAVGIFGSIILFVPLAFASTSLSVQLVSPGASVFANSKITFTITGSGFLPQAYKISDSFPNSTVSVNNISGSGNFSWVPVVSDIGTHVLSINATDYSGDAASTTETITVEPPPSVSATSISPGNTIQPGTRLTFSVSTLGFINPSYIVSDSFSQTTINSSDLDTSGNFSWTPADISQDGQHTINIYAYDSLGHTASINVPVLVGHGSTLIVQSLSPGVSVSPSQPISFTVGGSNFSPNSFSLSDSFPNTTITNADINTSGAFYWVPQNSDAGTHILTITGTIGEYGQSATTTQTIMVLGTSTPTALAIAPAATSTVIPGFTFTVTLYSGMRGNNVTELQTILSQQGFFSGVPSGYFGPLTVAAVKKFQAMHGLQQLGVVGPATRAALNLLLTGSQTVSSTVATSSPTSSGYTFQNSVSFGQNGTDVLELQKRLAALGFFSVQPTGYFGIATLEAVLQFQKAKGIPMVDQIGPATRAALNQ